MAILTAPVAADTATAPQHGDCGANTVTGNTDVVLEAALEASSRAQRALTAAQQVSKELRAVEMLAACGVATVVFGVVPSFLQCVFLLLGLPALACATLSEGGCNPCAVLPRGRQLARLVLGEAGGVVATAVRKALTIGVVLFLLSNVYRIGLHLCFLATAVCLLWLGVRVVRMWGAAVAAFGSVMLAILRKLPALSGPCDA